MIPIDRFHRALLAASLAGCAFLRAGLAHAGDCATTVGELRELTRQPRFALRWQETTMSDGKPLLVRLTESGGGLHLEFLKAQEGLWAEGAARICAGGGGLEAVLAQQDIRVGPAAHWLLRQSLRHGARFVLAVLPGGELRIATRGWSGVFRPVLE